VNCLEDIFLGSAFSQGLISLQPVEKALSASLNVIMSEFLPKQSDCALIFLFSVRVIPQPASAAFILWYVANGYITGRCFTASNRHQTAGMCEDGTNTCSEYLHRAAAATAKHGWSFSHPCESPVWIKLADEL